MPILDYLFSKLAVTETVGSGFTWASAFIQDMYQKRTKETTPKSAQDNRFHGPSHPGTGEVPGNC